LSPRGAGGTPLAVGTGGISASEVDDTREAVAVDGVTVAPMDVGDKVASTDVDVNTGGADGGSPNELVATAAAVGGTTAATSVVPPPNAGETSTPAGETGACGTPSSEVEAVVEDKSPPGAGHAPAPAGGAGESGQTPPSAIGGLLSVPSATGGASWPPGAGMSLLVPSGAGGALGPINADVGRGASPSGLEGIDGRVDPCGAAASVAVGGDIIAASVDVGSD
jgi:hypothetical protein